MGVKDIFKVSRKTFFNPREWIGFDLLKDQSKTIWSFFRSVTVPMQPERTESFKEAMARLNVSEQDLEPLAKRFFLYALFFLGLTILNAIYGFYLLLHHHAFLGLVLAIAVCGLLLAQAFKYHFWYFQIKNRKLGCTIGEWRRGKIDSMDKGI